jgi:hypothetical protein
VPGNRGSTQDVRKPHANQNQAWVKVAEVDELRDLANAQRDQNNRENQVSSINGHEAPVEI